MGRHRQARCAVIASAVVGAAWVSAARQAPPDVDALLMRVGARVADYYQRAQYVIFVEHSTVQPIQWNWTPDGLSRTVESDLRVEAESTDDGTLPGANLIRDVRRINGRTPRERDKKDRSGCTDPSPLSPEPLAFLLPTHRTKYRFTTVRTGKEQDREALVIDFLSTNRTTRLELIEDERGHDDCFDWAGPIATGGRIWVDAQTHDILRVERRLDGPADVRVPWKLQRRYGFDPWLVIDRDEQTLRYKPVAFSDPDEILVLPSSIVSTTVVRGGLQSTRRTETFSGYRRFLTAGRVIRDLREP